MKRTAVIVLGAAGVLMGATYWSNASRRERCNDPSMTAEQRQSCLSSSSSSSRSSSSWHSSSSGGSSSSSPSVSRGGFGSTAHSVSVSS